MGPPHLPQGKPPRLAAEAASGLGGCCVEPGQPLMAERLLPWRGTAFDGVPSAAAPDARWEVEGRCHLASHAIASAVQLSALTMIAA